MMFFDQQKRNNWALPLLFHLAIMTFAPPTPIQHSFINPKSQDLSPSSKKQWRKLWENLGCIQIQFNLQVNQKFNEKFIFVEKIRMLKNL
jgi:hypothetical protein